MTPTDQMSHPQEKGSKVSHPQRGTKIPSHWSGIFAVLAGLFYGPRRGALPAPRRSFLAVVPLCATALLTAAALTATTAAASEIHVFSGAFGSGSSTPANPYPLSAPTQLAVDSQSHDVYVTDPGNNRVERFDSAGHFLLMFGKDVNKTKVEEAGSSQAERDLCTAASGNECQPGVPGPGAGSFEEPAFLAVDGTPSGEGDVYVASQGSAASEVQTLTVDATGGAFTLSFEGKTTDPIAANAPANTQEGGGSVEGELNRLSTIGLGNSGSQFTNNTGVTGPRGGPYRIEFRKRLERIGLPQIECNPAGLTGGASTCAVATQTQGFDSARTAKFSSSGALLESWATGGALAVGEIRSLQSLDGLAVDSTGQLQVLATGQDPGDTGAPTDYLFRFAPDAAIASELTIDGSSEPESGLALDSADNIFFPLVGVKKYEPSGKEVGEVRSGTAVGPAFAGGLALDPSLNDLYVSNRFGEHTIRRYRLAGADQVIEPDASACFFRSGQNVPSPDCPPTETFGQGQLGVATGAGELQGLAVDPSTHALYAAHTGAGEVVSFASEIVPDVVTGQESNVTATGATLNGTVNPDGIPVTECKFEYVEAAEYKPSEPNPYAAGHTEACAETVGSGTSPVSVHADVTGLAPGTFYHFRLVAANANGRNQGADVELAPPAPPLVRATSADAIGSTKATLHAEVNAHSVSTTYDFEYITEADYIANGNGFSGAHPATSTPESASIGEDFVYHPAAVHLTDLHAETTYRYRVVATNAKGTTPGPAQSFTTLPPALVEGPWATDVSASAATLSARIDPLGADTTYRLEYGTTIAYGQALTGDVGAGEAYVPVSGHLSELAPHTTYHYRLVTTTTGVGSVETSDRTFTTQPAAAGLLLPDQRAWEQATPPDKHGADIGFVAGKESVQAAAGGAGVSYIATSPVTEASRHGGETVVLSTRTAAGWRSAEPIPAASLPEGPEESGGLAQEGGVPPPPFLSSDLSRALIEPNFFVKGLSPEATERTLYIWDAATDSYLPLVTPADVETRSEFGGEPPTTEMKFLGATPDLSHVVFASIFALTSGSLPGANLAQCEGGVCNPEFNLYEWFAGRLHLVNVLPSGHPTPGGAYLGSEEDFRVVHSISTDGRWVVWTNQTSSGGSAALYVRDMIAEKTYRVGSAGVTFETMSPDGSRVFYDEAGDLHVLSTATRSQTDLTASHGPGETSAGVQALVGASQDGRSLYFVAGGVLTGAQENANHESAESGKDNLYLLHESAGVWTTTYIATLSPADQHSWLARQFFYRELQRMTSHVSPDGRWLAFMSERPLTGYDNLDAASGERDEEVFLYDAAANGGAGRLLCASCNPTGARPRGALDRGYPETLVDLAGAWEGRWLAASMPGWRSVQEGRPMYEPHVIFDSGRLFFQSSDALVPQDTNGAEDVYEFEPPGVGTCTEQSPTFSPRSGGCVSLISSGTSAKESIFYDASESGNDVFFATNSSLVPTDLDKGTDVYDARVEGGFPEPIKPPPCEGDACQPPTEAPNEPTLSTSVPSGPGNEHPVRKHHKHHKKHRRSHHKRAASHKRGGGR